MYRVGCDVGGTNTDAALLDISKLNTESKGVLSTCKTPTTAKVTDGIRTAIETVLAKSEVNREEVLNVAIGTTHFVNAVVENDSSRLQKVACVRLCGPYTRAVGTVAQYLSFAETYRTLRSVISLTHCVTSSKDRITMLMVGLR